MALITYHQTLITNHFCSFLYLFERNALSVLSVFQPSPSSLFIGIPAETSDLNVVSGIFQPECR